MNNLTTTRVPGAREPIPYEPTALAEARPMPKLDPESSPGWNFVSLAAYWNILLKRRWTLLTSALVITTLVAIGSFKMKPLYRATSRVQVEAETPLVQSLNDLYQKMEMDDAFLQTQIQVLESEKLAWQTVEQLRLVENADFIDPKTIEGKDDEDQRQAERRRTDAVGPEP